MARLISELLDDSGFSEDRQRSFIDKKINKARDAGFSDKVIAQEYGDTADTYVQVALESQRKVNKLKFTPILPNGVSPIIKINNELGFVDFDHQEKKDSDARGPKFLFNRIDGFNSFEQLEIQNQVPSWENNPNAQQEWEDYKTFPPLVREEMIRHEISRGKAGDILVQSINEDWAWEDVKEKLKKENTSVQGHNRNSITSLNTIETKEIEEGFTDAERNLRQYHWDSLYERNGAKSLIQENGAKTTVLVESIRVTPRSKKHVNVPAYLNKEGRIIEDEAELREYWKKEIKDGHWPIYSSGEEAAAAAESLHLIIEEDSQDFTRESLESDKAKFIKMVFTDPEETRLVANNLLGKGFRFLTNSVEDKEKSKAIEDIFKKYSLPEHKTDDQWTLLEAMKLGINSSTLGMLWELKKINSGDEEQARSSLEFWMRTLAYNKQSFGKELAFDWSALLGDMPIMAPAAMAGAFACTPAGPLAMTACGMGAAFGVPAAIRSLIVDTYEADLASTPTEIIPLLANALEKGGESFLIGFLAGGVGGTISKKLAYSSPLARNTAQIIGESAVMAEGFSLAEGEFLPTDKDFIKTVLTLATFKGAMHGIKESEKRYETSAFAIKRNLQKLYKDLGVDPRAVSFHIERNPELLSELSKVLSQENYVTPKFYLKFAAEMMSRIEKVRQKRVIVQNDSVVISRYMNVKPDGATSLEVFARKEETGENFGKLFLKIKNDGDWELEKFEWDGHGELNAPVIQEMFKYIENLDRDITFPENYIARENLLNLKNILESTEKTETSSLAEEEQLANEFTKRIEAEATIFELEGEVDAAKEIKRNLTRLQEGVIPKEFLEKFKEKEEQAIEGILRDLSKQTFKETGFHLTGEVAKNQGLDDALGPIEPLKLIEHDQHTEIILNGFVKNNEGIGKEHKGWVLFGSDNFVRDLNVDQVVRTHLFYETPLDLRSIDGVNMESGLELTTLLHTSGKGIPGTLGRLTLEEVENIKYSEEPLQAIANILLARKFDSILYRKKLADGSVEDVVALIGDGKTKILGYAEKGVDDFIFGLDEVDYEAPQGTAAGGGGGGGFNPYFTEESLTGHPVLNSLEVLQFYKLLSDGKIPEVRKQLVKGARGLFQYRSGTENYKIQLSADLPKESLQQALATTAHEIGHFVFYLEGPALTMEMGNPIGHLVGLSKFMQEYFESKPGGLKALTEAEKKVIYKKAKKILEEQAEILAKELKEETGQEITAQQIKDIFTGVAGREDAHPGIYRFIVESSKEKKKEILRAVMGPKGKVPAELAKLQDLNKNKKRVSKKDIVKLYSEMFVEEVSRRELLKASVIRDELRLLTLKWRPFDPERNASYTKYRFNNKELMADFFSAFLTNPLIAETYAPMSFKGFNNWMGETRPKAFETYEKIKNQNLANTTLDVASKELQEGFDKNYQEYIASLGSKPSFWKIILESLVDKNISSLTDAKKSGYPESIDPTFEIEELAHSGALIEKYITHLSADIFDKLKGSNIDFSVFGEYLFHKRVMSDRAELFNPGNWTPTTSGERIVILEKAFPDISNIQNSFWEFRKQIVFPKLRQSGLITSELMDKLEENSAYATFSINKYAKQAFGEGGTGKLIFPQVGTLDLIKNPFSATTSKDMMLLVAAERNITMAKVSEFYRRLHEDSLIAQEKAKEKGEEFEDIFPFEEAKPYFNKALKRMEFKAPSLEAREKNLVLLSYMVEGKLKGVYVDRYVKEIFEKDHLSAYNFIRLNQQVTSAFRNLYTNYNPGFWSFNIFRDFGRAVKNLPAKGANRYIPYKQGIEFLNYYRKAVMPAGKSAYNIPNSIIDEMLDVNALLSVVELTQERPGGGAEGQLIESQKSGHWNRDMKPFDRLIRWLQNTGQWIERVPKVAGWEYLKENFPEISEKERAHMVRVQVGSPDFLRRGSLAPVYNNIIMFSNAAKEGYRGDIEVMRARPIEFWYKTIQYGMVPKALLLMAAYGYFGEEYKNVLDGVSEYNRANYVIIPIGLTPSGKSVYIRIPQDETNRLIGGTMYKILRQVFEENRNIDPLELVNYGAGQLPGLVPQAKIFSSILELVNGHNPYDSFRGREAIDSTVWDAGGTARAEALAKYFANIAGAGIVYHFNTEEPGEILSTMEKFLHFPLVDNVVGRFVVISNRGLTEQIANTGLVEKQTETRARTNIEVIKILDKLAKSEDIPIHERLTIAETTLLAQNFGSLQRRQQKLLAAYLNNVVWKQLLKAPNKEAQIAILVSSAKLAKTNWAVKKALSQITTKKPQEIIDVYEPLLEKTMKARTESLVNVELSKN